MSMTSNGAARKVAQRPAESAGLAAAVAVLIVTALGVDDPQVFGALVIVVGAVPTAVTFAVEQVRGRRTNGG